MDPWVVASRCGTYRSLFDRRTGLLARFPKEPIVPRPELIELALVGPEGELCDLEALRDLLDQAPLCRQLLLTGDPAAHPALPGILRTIRDHGVVPTAVLGPTPAGDEAIDALQRWAVGVGVDCGLDMAGLDEVNALRQAGVRVTVHLPVADATIDRVATLIEAGDFDAGIRGVLLSGRTKTGPLGRPTGLTMGPELERLIETAARPHQFKLGCDGRLGPLLNSFAQAPPATLAVCEAGRSGLFVRWDMTVTPCSLLPDRAVGSLAHQRLDRIWASHEMIAFRREFRESRPCECTSWAVCRGGCPAAAQICGHEQDSPGTEGLGSVDLRFGFATSSLCDRAHLALDKGQLVRTLTAVRAWSTLRFFDEGEPDVAASWSNLEYFLSLPSMWGQDLARLHEQLVAGTFEGAEVALR